MARAEQVAGIPVARADALRADTPLVHMLAERDELQMPLKPAATPPPSERNVSSCAIVPVKLPARLLWKLDRLLVELEPLYGSAVVQM